MTDRYWELAASKGRDDNPYRLSFLQLIGVADSDAEAEDIYGAARRIFLPQAALHAAYYQQIPGCLEYPALVQALRHNPRAEVKLGELKAKDFYERGFVMVGSPKTVREQLMEGMKRLRVGHLLTLLHFGSMPTESVQAQYRPVRPRGAAASRAAVGRQIRRPLVAQRLRAKRPAAAAMAVRLKTGRSCIMAGPEVRRLRLWQDRIETEVEIAGSGPPLVYLHGPWGLNPDRAFIARLAGAHTVYAPRHPGTTPGDPDAVHALDGWLDLARLLR